MSRPETLDTKPWYRYLWPWLLMLPPATAVVGSAISITLAIRSADGLVVDDYYRQGRAINQQIARKQMAASLGLEASLYAQGLSPGDEVRVRLSAERSIPPEASLKLRLVHPGRDGADREAIVARVAVNGDGRQVEYVGHWQETAPVTAQVGWRFVLEARDWRLAGDASTIAAGVALRISAGGFASPAAVP